jgi:hypothetical protein
MYGAATAGHTSGSVQPGRSPFQFSAGSSCARIAWCLFGRVLQRRTQPASRWIKSYKQSVCMQQSQRQRTASVLCRPGIRLSPSLLGAMLPSGYGLVDLYFLPSISSLLTAVAEWHIARGPRGAPLDWSCKTALVFSIACQGCTRHRLLLIAVLAC